jgi:glycosyltransferase involved in cell wall biosynthesis
MPYSVLVLTHNEANNIERCLASLTHCDDVVVLDSQSTDDTCARAQRMGARIVARQFDSFAGQRNWAIDNVVFHHPWVLHLDADECVTPELHAEIEGVTQKDARSAFLVANKLIFMGRWIRRASMYPFYQARLLKVGEARFTQHGHGQVLAHAERGVGKLSEPYVHYNFSRGVSDWVERHNRYSSQEAHRLARGGTSLLRSLKDAVAGASSESRQQGLKRLADVLPFRPFFRFFYLYILRGAFLDGRPGFDYCVLMAFYDYLIRLKALELRTTRTLDSDRRSPP